MERKTIDKLMNILIGISVSIVIIGTFLKMQHHSSADSIIRWGFVSAFIFSSIDNIRLKNIIKKHEEGKEE